VFHVIYVSRACKPLSGADLLDLLKVSRRRNGRLLLTGLLLYADGRFMQVLEGKEQSVREVYDSILADSRHTDIQTLRLQEKEKRHFPDWTMAFGDLADLSATEAAVDSGPAANGGSSGRYSDSIALNTPGISRFLEPGFEAPTLREESSDVYKLLRAFRDDSSAGSAAR
ncbi:MAG: BLUF domain-containing protein, partial [Pseudomonadales bacterium]|nr:BLUF domain-containing protein [Pseudomonadales bacterium]